MSQLLCSKQTTKLNNNKKRSSQSNFKYSEVPPSITNILAVIILNRICCIRNSTWAPDFRNLLMQTPVSINYQVLQTHPILDNYTYVIEYIYRCTKNSRHVMSRNGIFFFFFLSLCMHHFDQFCQFNLLNFLFPLPRCG